VASVLNDDQKEKMPLVTHPVVRSHPVTGRKALYAVSGSSFGIVGMPDDEARGLLDELAAHATQPKYRLSLSYASATSSSGTTPRCCIRRRSSIRRYPRTLWRITLKEPAATGRARHVLAASFRAM
jgi:hypothetical protein